MIKYQLRTDSFYNENNIAYISYGIDVVNNKTILKSIKDISLDRESLKELVRMCNQLKLSEIHIDDVVEDYLAK